MKIKSIRIRNFRSIKEETCINLEHGLNIFVGENNVGKSNIFLALKKLGLYLKNKGNNVQKDQMYQEPIFIVDDWNMNAQSSPLVIEVILSLSDEEKKEILETLISSFRLEEKRKEEAIELCTSELIITLEATSINRFDQPLFKLGDYYVIQNSITNNKDIFKTSHQVIGFKQWVEKMKKTDDHLVYLLKECMKEMNNGAIQLDNFKLYELLSIIFYKNIKVFEDIRVKPSKEEKQIEESLDGYDLAATLITLKDNQSPKLREKFSQIQTIFNKSFPELKIDVTRDGNMIDCVVISVKNNIQHSLIHAGRGVLEFLVILASLIESKGNVFVFEEPELHLHPSAQRLVFRLLKEYTSDNQVIILTHSPLFIDTLDITKNRIVKLRDNLTVITSVEKDEFDNTEKLKICKELMRDNKEIFFSRSVLLVEGPTEKGVLSILAEKIGTPLEVYNIFVCSVDGKESFNTYQKILEKFEIPYVILCDEDALKIDSVNNYSQKIVLKPDFENIILQSCSHTIIQETERLCGRSKTRKGVYIAERIGSDQIPSQFRKIIELAIKLSSNQQS